MTPVIEFESVSKLFQMHRDGPRSFQESVINLFHRHRGTDNAFWVLKDVSFTVQEGETVGIIGANGAGKSTVLKLITRIIEPTFGEVRVTGRVGALLELGAGFHPDLTGRENIFMNGSILGLSHAEVRKRLDSIVAFSELEQFIDVPVKHYSSGMYVRLGFAVAVHTDPDILIVDEVLAVGDLAFQKKCMDSIAELRRAGATLILVSHSLDSVRQICQRAIWLDDAHIVAQGDVDSVVGAYLKQVQQSGQETFEDSNFSRGNHHAQRWGTQEACITEVTFEDSHGTPQDSFTWGAPFRARIRYSARQRIPSPAFGIAIYNADGLNLTGPNSVNTGFEIPFIEGEGEVTYILDSLLLQPGEYEFTAAIYDHNSVHPFDHQHRAYTFRVSPSPVGPRAEGLIDLPCRWDHHPS